MTTENVTFPEGSAFERWVLSEGLAITQQQLIPDIVTLEQQPWERTASTPRHQHFNACEEPIRYTARRFGSRGAGHRQ